MWEAGRVQMDFNLEESQSLLRDGVRRVLSDGYSPAERRRSREGPCGFSPRWWSLFGDLGWLAAPFGERYGGLGGDAIDIMIIMEELGRALVVEPYLSAIVLAGGLLARAGSTEQMDEWLLDIASGNRRLALAYAEPQSRYDLFDVATTATRDRGGWILNGHKVVVLNGAGANGYLVSTRTAGSPGEIDGVTLFLVPSDAPGVSISDYPSVDGGRACDLRLSNVRLDDAAVVGRIGEGAHPLADTIDDGCLAVCAEGVGIMESTHNATLDYVKTRVQFGKPIGTFQVVQHRLADMFIELEQTRSLLYLAAVRARDGHPLSRAAISALKVQVSRAGRFIGQQAVQLHGGIGMTDELNIGWALKRLIAIEVLFGDLDFHLARYRASSVAAE